ncbi:type II secretion system protein [Achromobacter xylosoxidans]
MLVTLALLSLLTVATLPLAESAKRRADEGELRRALVTIRGGLDAYKAAYDAGRIERTVGKSGYPPDLRILVDGVEDKGAGGGGQLYFLRRIPADPFCDCEGKAPEDMWETRSYESAPDIFASGEDVYDIRSTSQKEGLNGIPYNEW